MFGLFKKELNDDEKQCLGFICGYIENMIKITEKGHGRCVCNIRPFLDSLGSINNNGFTIHTVVFELYNEDKKDKIVDYIESMMNIYLNERNSNKYVAMEKAFGCDLNWGFDNIDEWKNASVNEMGNMNFTISFAVNSSNKKTILSEVLKRFENRNNIYAKFEKSNYVYVFIKKND